MGADVRVFRVLSAILSAAVLSTMACVSVLNWASKSKTLNWENALMNIMLHFYKNKTLRPFFKDKFVEP